MIDLNLEKKEVRELNHEELLSVNGGDHVPGHPDVGIDRDRCGIFGCGVGWDTEKYSKMP